jgi:hypothetical protein
MPAVSAPANDRWRNDDRCHYERGRRYHHDAIGAASTIRAAVKADATAALGAGAVDRDE